MNDRFVKGLAGREKLTIIRKAGWWEDWRHDTADITAYSAKALHELRLAAAEALGPDNPVTRST